MLRDKECLGECERAWTSGGEELGMHRNISGSALDHSDEIF